MEVVKSPMDIFILSCEDGGFLQVGETFDFSGGISAKMYIVKTNSNGQLLWEREFTSTITTLEIVQLKLKMGMSLQEL